jgi:alpha-galactosidase
VPTVRRYEFVNSDEGWEKPSRDAKGKIEPNDMFTNGTTIKQLVDKIHSMGLKIGLYGAASGVTCGNMPGQLYHEDVDAETFV